MGKVQTKIGFLMRLADERGSVLLVTYMLGMVLTILGAAFVVASMNESRIAESHRRITQAFNLAEAGIERMLYDLKEDYDDNQDWADDTINTWTYDSSDTDADGYFPFPDASDVANAAYPVSTLGDTLGNNSYAISLKSSSNDMIWIRSTGTIGSIQQTIIVYAKIVSLSPWDNAIFGGSGSSGGWVNGNVNVAGSVHILGEGLDPGDNAIDLGGTAELEANNYDKLDTAQNRYLEDLIPALDMVDVNGEMSETLHAELRVKNGLVGLSGSSSVGEADAAGDAEKELVDGVYVTDGYNGSAGSGNVYSDNGYSNSYDLGDAVDFPSLNDPYPDNPAQNFYQYFNANGLVLTNELSAVTPGSNFTYGNCATNCITMNGATGEMEIEGLVYVSGNNNLSMTGGDITYTGKGSILVTGNALVDVNLVVKDTSGKGSYPENVVGIMTPNDITVGSSSQLDIMGLFFAEHEIITAKQTDVIGSFVCNQFNITGQVPSIFQVPDTADNLPPGMIGGDPVYIMKIVSWQKADNAS